MIVVEVVFDEVSDLFTLSLPSSSASRERVGARLTDAEWADYQRVQAEFAAWQDRISSIDTVSIAPSASSAAAAKRQLERYEANRAGSIAGYKRLRAAIDAGLLHED